MGAVTVPQIDLKNFETRKAEVTEQLMWAATNIGFFYVVNHGIPLEQIDGVFATAKEFFDLSDEAKAKYFHEKTKNVGWEKRAQIRPSTGTPDLKESLQLGYINMENKWPSESDCPNFAHTSKLFMDACHEVSLRILSCFAVGLGFPENFFDATHDRTAPDCLATLRMLMYHDVTGQTFPDTYWRAGSHTDFDSVTLLFQRPGQGGLEVCPGREATTSFATGNVWHPVPPLEGAICINIGDMLMRWSDDRLKSNFHRVRVPQVGEYQGPRYSIAFFQQANKKAVIQGPQKKYPAITGEQFILDAMHRNFSALQQKLGEQENGSTNGHAAAAN